MKYTLPVLPYAYNALEPAIDARTMEIHHTKHHQAYIDKLNEVLGKHPEIAETPLEVLMEGLETLQIPDADKTMLRNHGGGHLNHSFFWKIMGPEKKIDEALCDEIAKEFGSVEAFKKEFAAAAMGRFGSGWAWLVRTPEKKLSLYATPNQDSPYLNGDLPLIGLDVWEHAYYLSYQNKRADYIAAWWQVLTVLE